MYRLSIALVVAAISSPALAANVTFTGTLSGVCTLAVPTNGTLGLSPNGDVLGSATGGTPATVTIVSVGSNTVTVNPPTWNSQPAGYVASGEVLEVAYSGLGGLSLINQAYTNLTTNFGILALPLSSLIVNARVTNSHGFAAGTYQMQVVVTCS